MLKNSAPASIAMFVVSLYIRVSIQTLIWLNKYIPRTKKAEPIFYVNCNVCGFALYSKIYLKLHLTKPKQAWEAISSGIV